MHAYLEKRLIPYFDTGVVRGENLDQDGRHAGGGLREICGPTALPIAVCCCWWCVCTPFALDLNLIDSTFSNAFTRDSAQDTVGDKALRVVDGAIYVAKSAPLGTAVKVNPSPL